MERATNPSFKALELRDMRWAENAGANEKSMQNALDNRQEKNLQKYIILYGKNKIEINITEIRLVFVVLTI